MSIFFGPIPPGQTGGSSGGGGNTTIVVPASGGTVVIGNSTRELVLNPPGIVASLTLDLPSGPIANEVTIRSTQPISQLSVVGAGGQTVLAAPPTLAAGQMLDGLYDVGSSTWFFGL